MDTVLIYSANSCTVLLWKGWLISRRAHNLA